MSPFDFNNAYQHKETVFRAELGLAASGSSHGTAIGDATEEKWRSALSTFLPTRYAVGKGKVIDSAGSESDAIDVVVYDRQYSPLFLGMADGVTIPAESVYAVFEVKQELNKEHVDYACSKVASVRRLTRTSVPIPHAGGVFPPQNANAKPIIGGILATRNEWASMGAPAALAAMRSGGPDGHLDFMAAANEGAVEWHDDQFAYAPDSLPLAWFQYRLHQRLFAVGTALALDIAAYWHAAEAPRPIES